MFDIPATIMKDFKKNAQFPGFRKGTIPPFMLPKVKQFVILDCLEKTLSEAVKDEVFSSLPPTLLPFSSHVKYARSPVLPGLGCLLLPNSVLYCCRG